MKQRTLVALLIIETVILDCYIGIRAAWKRVQVQIILSGEEQPTACYILPYKTLEEN